MINGKTVLCEVGCGSLSMTFSALVWDRPDIEILAFEPNPEFYAEIAEAAKGRLNVALHNMAIGDENGEMDFLVDGTSSTLVGTASPIAQHHGKQEGQVVKVQVRKISEFDHGQIDLLRLDTEGSEWFCLKHLVSRPKQIVVEMYNDLATYINPRLFEIERWCKDRGYKKMQVRDSDFIYQLP